MAPRWKKLLLSVTAAVGLIASASAPAEQIKDRVLQEGRITIGMENSAPWAYKTADGTVTGVHPDLIRAVLEPLGIKQFDFVIIDFGALIPSLLAKKIDVVASGMGITPARCKQVIFSDPDLASTDAILVKKGNPLNIHSYEDIVKNPGIRMGGYRGSSNTENALAAGIPQGQMQLFQDVDGLSAIQAGRIDALTLGVATAERMLKQPLVSERLERATPFKGHILKNGREAANYGAMVFRPEDTQLRDAYNASFEKLRANGTVKRILAKYGFQEAPDGLTAKDLCSPDYYK
ncbi:ectoine/hydroxyectoine ABC transporter substrate-binding protein EhuB [Paraburkholderia sabiae]|uniref:Ectoine/hydroxyectoine ABC transporter substrate-binding protein EhuB n=1 Tax=Paraburkholderia sabiae TaxID=273251 RepID=A0ABU9QRJ3_9BURK|nr:ectoine/hydroxyectoine ABC transporter substrate-binding protein EhuB [Paraburkholderia sabiae]WJZ79528.1 ectoine/hydroxyectoine ABC transporter substrate-binding protein EhuB [Paraburkholderia sabiae]CAD6562972.1 Histidine-binding periplasmic protein [Paraburkholderia sabiae]